MTSFPDSADYFAQQLGTAVAASITLPAESGLTWVLTAINAQMFSNSNVTAQEAIATSPSGPFGYIYNAADAGGFALGSWSWTGALPFGVGTAVTVGFQSSEAGLYQVLEVQAYLI